MDIFSLVILGVSLWLISGTVVPGLKDCGSPPNVSMFNPSEYFQTSKVIKLKSCA